MKNDSNVARLKAEEAKEKDEFVNRKLIRPALISNHVQKGAIGDAAAQSSAIHRKRASRVVPPVSVSPERTHAEDFFFQKQIQARTMMHIVLRGGEEVQGAIEWYDKNSIRLSRPGKPNLLLYKTAIRFMHKS